MFAWDFSSFRKRDECQTNVLQLLDEMQYFDLKTSSTCHCLPSLLHKIGLQKVSPRGHRGPVHSSEDRMSLPRDRLQRWSVVTGVNHVKLNFINFILNMFLFYLIHYLSTSFWSLSSEFSNVKLPRHLEGIWYRPLTASQHQLLGPC